MNDRRKEVILKLLNKIHSGEIVTDDKLLPERQLAEIINEPRPTLREGLISLEAMGVVDIRDRQGIYLSTSEENDAKMLLQKVHGWPADMCSRAMELRQIIEPSATAMAAVRRDEKDLKRLRICLNTLKPLSKKSDPDSIKLGTYWNKEFHIIIVHTTNNAYLARVYESVQSAINQAVYIMRESTAPGEQGGRRITYEDHEKIYECIENKDPKGARECAQEHLAHTVKAMIKLGEMVPISDLFTQGFIRK